MSTEAVALVDATADVLEFLERTLDGRSYTVLLFDSRTHAHAEIKRLRPRLVIVCTRFERLDCFRLLTMLKLDGATSRIPVVTVPVEDAEQDEDCAAILGVPVNSFARPS
jgi:DNA-binding response OmpR family regulator